MQERARQRSLQGGWAVAGASEEDEDERPGTVGGVSRVTLAQLQQLGVDFGQAMDRLVALLRATEAITGSEIMRFLIFRLDFNGFHGLA